MGVLAVLQHGGARAVAEEDAGVAILPVHDGGEFLRADHQHGVVRAGHDELLPDLECVNEPGAGRLDVERRRVVCAEFFLHKTGRCREGHVRRDGGEDDQIDIGGIDLGPLKRALRRVGGHVGGVLVVGGDAALLDAGACGDPLVGRVYPFLEVGVGQHFFRHVGADGGDGAGAPDEVVLGAGVFDVGIGHA